MRRIMVAETNERSPYHQQQPLCVCVFVCVCVCVTGREERSLKGTSHSIPPSPIRELTIYKEDSEQLHDASGPASRPVVWHSFDLKLYNDISFTCLSCSLRLAKRWHTLRAKRLEQPHNESHTGVMFFLLSLSLPHKRNITTCLGSTKPLFPWTIHAREQLNN